MNPRTDRPSSNAEKTPKGPKSGEKVIGDGVIGPIQDHCETAFEYLMSREWQSMEVDISEIRDIKTDAVLTAADLEKRKLNTTIGFVRPKVKFSRHKEDRDVLYYSYENDGRQITRAFSKRHESDAADSFDEICRLGITGKSPHRELRDFESGEVEIVIEISNLGSKNSFPIRWKNELFKQSGNTHLH